MRSPMVAPMDESPAEEAAEMQQEQDEMAWPAAIASLCKAVKILCLDPDEKDRRQALQLVRDTEGML